MTRRINKLHIAATSALALAALPVNAATPDAAITAIEKCKPGGACSKPLRVKIVIVTMFEIGKDSGDAPGEFQLWKERRGLDVRIPFPQSHHDLFYNPKTGVLGVVTGMGNTKSATATMALGLDQRFDLSKAYWIVAGIAGVDPEDASVGSAAWARYIVDGDLAHEIDAREIPVDWKTGYFALNQKGPNDRNTPKSQGELFELNGPLRDWAYELSKDIKLPDDPKIMASRARYVGFPNAQRPPFVLKGDQLASSTYWHGTLMNRWANDWTRYWTEGKGEFVTTAMEESGTAQAINYLDRIDRADRNRFMVLRAASNYAMPPPGISAADNMLSESDGYAGMTASLESLYLVAGKVIDALLGNWEKYENKPPE
jgi:purine nucleoside permease